MEFWDIHNQYYAKVRKFILANVRDEWVADDLIQETFARVLEKMDSIKDPSNLSSWIFRIAYNLCRDHFRQSKKSQTSKDIYRETMGGYKEVCVQKELEKHQMGQCVQEKVNLLPESLRTVLLLSDIMDFSHQEIADILGITAENAKVRLHRARKKMKTILEQECTFEKDERNILICEPKN